MDNSKTLEISFEPCPLSAFLFDGISMSKYIVVCSFYPQTQLFMFSVEHVCYFILRMFDMFVHAYYVVEHKAYCLFILT